MKKHVKTALLLLLFLLLFSCEKEEPHRPSVTFDYDFEGKTETVEIVEGKRLYPPVLYREGYSLYYWLYNGRPVEDWETFVPEDGMIFKAEWISRTMAVKLILNPNGGTCDVTEADVVAGEEYSLPVPKREGYYFSGWYFDPTKQTDPPFGSDIYFDPLEGGLWRIYRKQVDLIARWSLYPKDLPVYFGSFEQDGDETNGPEPVEWRVLDVRDGKCLLYAYHILDMQPFYDRETTYAASFLRKWCYSFYQDALSPEEKSLILPTKWDESISDYVTVLSREEVRQYLYDSENHLLNHLTPDLEKILAAKGLTTDDTRYIWTRTAEDIPDTYKPGRKRYIGYISDAKSDEMFCARTCQYVLAVRPAMWVDESVVIEAMKNYEGEKTP